MKNKYFASLSGVWKLTILLFFKEKFMIASNQKGQNQRKNTSCFHKIKMVKKYFSFFK